MPTVSRSRGRCGQRLRHSGDESYMHVQKELGKLDGAKEQRERAGGAEQAGKGGERFERERRRVEAA